MRRMKSKMSKIQKAKGKRNCKHQALKKEFIFKLHKNAKHKFACSLKSIQPVKQLNSRKSSVSCSISNPSTHKTPPPPENIPKNSQNTSKQSNSASKTSYYTPNPSKPVSSPDSSSVSSSSSSWSSSSSSSSQTPKKSTNPTSREDKKILYYAQLFERQEKREEKNKKRKLAKQANPSNFKGKLSFRHLRTQKSFSAAEKLTLGLKIEIDQNLQLEKVHHKVFEIKRVSRQKLMQKPFNEITVQQEEEEELDMEAEDCLIEHPMAFDQIVIPKKVEESKEYEQHKADSGGFFVDRNLSDKDRQQKMKEIFISQIMEMTRAKQAEQKASLASLRP